MNESYFSDVLIAVKVPLSLEPTPLTAVMMAMAIPAAIKAYSMAVAADSSARKRADIFFKVTSWCTELRPVWFRDGTCPGEDKDWLTGLVNLAVYWFHADGRPEEMRFESLIPTSGNIATRKM